MKFEWLSVAFCRFLAMKSVSMDQIAFRQLDPLREQISRPPWTMPPTKSSGFPSARGSNIEAVHRGVVEVGIVFIPENGGGAGVRLRKS